MVRYLIAFQLQRHATFPLASLLGWEITDKASILVLPAGVQLLAFYFLRWWFVAFALVALRMLGQGEAFQYTIHVLIGDVTGAVGVMYAFYLVFKVWLIKLR